MKIALLLSLVLPWQEGEPGDFRIEPGEVSWTELREERFELRWTLPDRREEGRDLLAEMERLLALRFEADLGEGRVLRSFGDVVAAARPLGPEERNALLGELRTAAPGLMGDWGAGLSELLLDDRLYTDRWKPGKDHPRDGMLMADGWDLRDAGEPWSDIRVDPVLEQGATLFYCDLPTLKAAECDYRVYPWNVDANYLEIFPLEDTYVVGEDPEGRPFSALEMKFKADLPFPFSSYNTKLEILNRYRPDGVLQTDIYSTSSDFHWLAGRDVYLPVETSGGEFVSYLVVRHFGFDLDGVPDKRANRQEAVRGTLGNLRRNAEPCWDGVARRDPSFLREVPLQGNRDSIKKRERERKKREKLARQAEGKG